MVAYGADLSTTTYVLQWSWAGGAWVVLETHHPRFAQPYQTFVLRSRANNSYVGLVINPIDTPAAGLSSVLRSVTPGGGEDGMAGAYAFESSSWAYDVGDNGDVRALMSSPTNKSLSLSSFTSDGWASYPASDSWTNPTHVASPAGGVAGVTAIRGVGDLFFAWSAAADGSVEVGFTPLDVTKTWSSLGAPFRSVSLALGVVEPTLAWGGGVLCAAAHGANDGAVFVSCTRNTTAAAWDARFSWGPAVAALTNATSALAPGLAVYSTVGGAVRVVIGGAAVPAVNGTGSILTATCEIAASGPPLCAPTPLPALLFTAAPVTDFDMRGCAPGQAMNTSAPVLLVAAVGPADGTGDSLVSFTLSV